MGVFTIYGRLEEVRNYIGGPTYRVWSGFCHRCGAVHHHGAGDETWPQHRGAHCREPYYKDEGYYIDLVGRKKGVNQRSGPTYTKIDVETVMGASAEPEEE